MAKTKENRQGNATRQRLIKVAEKLFASQGVDAVSIRAVNAAAGLGPASVHYHFGSKAALLDAVLEDLGGAVREQITVRIGEIADAPDRPTATAITRAITDPFLQLIVDRPLRGIRWVKIIADLSKRSSVAANPPLLSALFLEQVQRAFPEADRERLPLRWAIALTSYLQSLADAEQWVAIGAGLPTDDLRAFHEDLVIQAVGGLEANIREDARRAEAGALPAS